jgi:hypothetical protein
MFLPRGIPQDVDDETYRRIAHSFYVVRMVRYALLAIFLVAFLVGVELRGWPHAAAVVVGVAVVALLGLLVATRRRYLRGRPSPWSPTSESPTG